MKKVAFLGLLAVTGTASSAHAFEFRVRFGEQTGAGANAFNVLPGNTIDSSNNAARRIRIQFGVFDDAAGPAPAGGYVGWNVGTLTVSGPAGNSDETRTPGRLNPFNFSTGVNANGNPPVSTGGDPFTMLTEIDNTLGTQTRPWPLGQPAPSEPLVRGFNTFVSTYEFTVNPVDLGTQVYTVTLTGNVIAATEWRVVGTPVPPEDANSDGVVDPGTGIVTYAPFPTPPQAISSVLNVLCCPGPGSASLLGLGSLLAARRRRGAASTRLRCL